MNSTVVSIPVGAEPSGIAIAPDGKHAYIGIQATSQVAVLDLVTARVVAMTGVLGTPGGVVAAADGRRVYVADTDPGIAPHGRIDVIDSDSNRVVNGIPVGRSAGEIAELPDGRLAVTDFEAACVVIVDPLSGALTTVDLSAEGGLMTLVAVPAARTLFVGVGSDVAALLSVDADEGTVEGRFDLDFVPGRGAVTPDGHRIYLCDPANALVHVIAVGSDSRASDPIAFDTGVSDVAVSVDGKHLYVVGSDRFWTVETAGLQLVGCGVPISTGSTALALTPDGSHAAVVDADNGAVQLIDLGGWTA